MTVGAPLVTSAFQPGISSKGKKEMEGRISISLSLILKSFLGSLTKQLLLISHWPEFCHMATFSWKAI
jgi:hypothetical protein